MRIIAVVFLSIMLSGCFISSPYKSLSTGDVLVTNDCTGSEEFKQDNLAYSCMFLQSEKITDSVSVYLMLQHVNGIDFNAKLGGNKVRPVGLTSVALRPNVPNNLDFVFVAVRDGWGWNNYRYSLADFTPAENKNYIAKVKYVDVSDFKIWIEDADTGEVVAWLKA